MILIKKILFTAAFLLPPLGFASDIAVPTLDDYQKTFHAAAWVAKVEVLSMKEVPVPPGTPTISGMPPELKLTVAVKSVLRADGSLPVAMFDQIIELGTNYRPAELLIGGDYYVFANKHDNGWYALGHNKLGFFRALSLSMGYNETSYRFVHGWLNNLHPKPPILPLDQTPGLALVMTFEGGYLQAPPGGWHLVPSTAQPSTPAKNAALNREMQQIDTGSGAVYLGPLVANPKGKGFVFPYLADPRFVKEKLGAGHYRLVSTIPQQIKGYDSQDSLRIQLKRSEMTHATIRLQGLEGDAAVAAMCPIAPGSRAYFEGEKIDANSGYLANHRLFLHARVERQDPAVYDSNLASYIHLGNNAFELEALGWYYGGKKPSAAEVTQQGLGRAAAIFYGAHAVTFAGEGLLRRTLRLQLRPNEYSFGAPKGALPMARDPKGLGEEIIIAVMPNHANADLSLLAAGIYPSPNPAKSMTDQLTGLSARETADKNQAEIAQQYSSFKASLHSYMCYGWARVKDGHIQWVDAPPEPLKAYFAHRAKRYPHPPVLTQSLANYHQTFTSPSTEAYELDLAGWR